MSKLTDLQRLIRKSERIRRQLGEKSSMQFISARAIPNNGTRSHSDYTKKKTDLERTERAINRCLHDITGIKKRTVSPKIPY